MIPKQPRPHRAIDQPGAKNRFVRACRRVLPSRTCALAIIISALACCGCLNDHSSEESGHDGDHAGHVIPAHKPKNIHDAVSRLRDLNATISLKVGEGKTRSLIDDKTLPIALDIATWLPEIAGDSDMPEGPWSEVNARSGKLVADYEKVLAAAPSSSDLGALAAVRNADLEISGLETFLAHADPRWFDKIERKKSPP
jgi:hypothetical protein